MGIFWFYVDQIVEFGNFAFEGKFDSLQISDLIIYIFLLLFFEDCDTRRYRTPLILNALIIEILNLRPYSTQC